MKKTPLLGICILLTILVSFSQFPVSLYAQAQLTMEKSSKSSGSSVSVNSNLTVEVSNKTMATKERQLIDSIIRFVNSGPNTLKTSEADHIYFKSRIVDEINNATQIVEGQEATNAIIGVQIGKSLLSLISSSNKPNQTFTVTVETSSTCKPAQAEIISCENNIVVK